MSQWKGLIWKEWMAYKSLLLIGLLINVLVVLMGPYLLKVIFGIDFSLGNVLLVLSSIWVLGHIIGMPILFFASLEKDMKRSDMWFHSNASMYKLLGAKLFAFFVFTFISLLVVIITTMIGYWLFQPLEDISMVWIMKLEVYFLFTSAFAALTFTIGILVTWVLGRLLRPINKALSNIVSIVFFFFAFHNYAKFTESKLYETLTSYWKVKLPEMNVGEISSKDFYMFLEVTDHFYVGQIILEFVVFTCLFIISTFVLQRKVRGYTYD